MTSALAPPLASIRTSAARPHTSRNRPIRLPLFELCGNLFGMLLVTLEDFQPGGEQVFEFRIAGRRNQRVLQSVVNGLMVAHHIVGESANVFVLALVKRLLCSRNVDLPGSVGNVSDLWVGQFFCVLCQHATRAKTHDGRRRDQANQHGLLPCPAKLVSPGCYEITLAWMPRLAKGS